MIAHVALPVPIHSFFSYRVPQRLEGPAQPFVRVKVPFRTRTLTGVVLEVDEGDGEGLKELDETLDFLPQLTSTDLDLCRWLSSHYVTPLGLVLKYALPPSIDPDRYLIVKSTHTSTEALDGAPLKKAIGLAGPQALLEQYRHGFLTLTDRFTGEPSAYGEEGHKGVYTACAGIGNFEFRKNKYISLILEALKKDQKALVLVPDHTTIGHYFYRAFSESFPGKVFWYVSSDRKAKRMEAYFRARGGTGCVIMGNKSCAFLPLSRMALIIVERPEEDEYRNEEAFKFDAVRVATKRAELEGVPLYLGSAAASLDIVRSVDDGLMEMERSEESAQAEVSVIKSPRPRYTGYAFPVELHHAIEQGLASGKTVALYVPRRDFASNLYCLDCRSAFLCSRCSGHVTYRKADNVLACSRCKRVVSYEEKCGTCGSTLVQFLSVGAEYLEEKVRESFPGTPVFAVTGEGTKGKGGSIHDRMAAISGGIVIGTSILTRLYGFQPQTLILLGLEELLRIAGYRAKEKVFQVFHNLKDALRPDRIVILERDDSDMTFLADVPQFYSKELFERKASGFPPYKRLFLILIDGMAGDGLVDRVEGKIRAHGLTEGMMGPMREAEGRGWRILLKGETEEVAPLLSSLYAMRGVSIECDPLSI